MKTKEKENTIIVSEADMSVKGASLILYEMKYSNLENKIAELEEERKALKAEIIAEFEKIFGHESKTITNTLTGNSLMRVISVNQTFDEDEIRKVVSDEVWNKITSRKIVRDLFLAAIKMGEIEARKVSPAIKTSEVDKIMVKANKRVKV